MSAGPPTSAGTPTPAGTPTLYPNPLLRGGPTLSLVDGWVVVRTPNGRTQRFATRSGRCPNDNGIANGTAGRPATVATLAHHTTMIRPPSGTGIRLRQVARSSWRLLDEHGRPLVWLANSDQALYDDTQAREFAAAAGLEFRDFGRIPNGELAATRPPSRVNGPGTGRLSSVVAPGRQWGMAAALVGGVAPIVPVAAASWSDGLIRGSGAVVVLVAFLTVAVAAPVAASYLAAGLAALRWRRYWSGHRRDQPSDRRLLVTADRLPGFALVAGTDRIQIRDLRRTHEIGPDADLTLQPYAIAPTAERYRHGLLIRGGNGLLAHIPARFDPEEVHAFAGAVGARSLPLSQHVDQVPKRRRKRAGRTGTADRPESFAIGGSWLYVAGAIGWVLSIAGPVLAAVAAASTADWVGLPWPYAVAMLGPGLLMVGAWALYVTQTPVWLRQPRLLGPTGQLDRGR